MNRERAVFRKDRRRRELDSTTVGFGGVPCAQVFEQKRDKARIGSGVEQGAFAWPLAHGGERAWILSLGVKTGPFDGQGQEIMRGFALVFGFEQRNSQIGIGRHDWNGADDMGRRQPASIPIPAPARKKCRKDIAFEYRFGTAAQQRSPAVGDDERLEFRPDPRALDRRRIRFAEQEPKESVGPQRHKVGTIANRRKVRSAEQFKRHAATPGGEIDLGGLRRARQIGDTKHDFVFVLPHVDEHGAICRADKRQRSAAKHLARLANRNQAFGPTQQRRQTARLRFDVDRLVPIDRVHDHWQVELRRVATGEPAIAIRRPLHRCAHAITIAEIYIVAHPDLVAVIDDRRAGKRHQQRVHQLDLPPVIVHQRRQSPSDPQIDAGARVGRIG